VADERQIDLYRFVAFPLGFVMLQPFSVFLRGNRPYYYVQFKNEETGGYIPAISTKKTNEKDEPLPEE